METHSSIQMKCINFYRVVWSNNVCSLLQNRVLLKFQFQCAQWTEYFSSNFNRCSKRLCEGIGLNLRKDDSCASTLAIYQMRFIYGGKVSKIDSVKFRISPFFTQLLLVCKIRMYSTLKPAVSLTGFIVKKILWIDSAPWEIRVWPPLKQRMSQDFRPLFVSPMEPTNSSYKLSFRFLGDNSEPIKRES